VQVNGSPYGYDNSITADLMREHPSRFLGVAMIPPSISEQDLQRSTRPASAPRA